MEHPSDTIRLLRVIARLNVGGPAIHTILLTKLLSPERFTSTLVTGQVSPNEGDMGYFANAYGVTPQILPELGREIHWRDDLIALWKMYRLIRRVRPTIVHTHTAKAGMLGRLAAKLAGVPILVHTFHGHVFHSYFSPLKTRVFLWIERMLGTWSDAIITVSPKQREEILSYGIGDPEKVRVIGLGLELQPFVNGDGERGTLRRELGLAPDTPLIGIVGRLVPVKGHCYFLEAAQNVLQRDATAHFVIVGDGELRTELEQYAKDLRIVSHVHFLGFRPNSPEIFVDLDLIALSSLNEGTPVTVIEAMASGKPVVATQVGGVGDLVQHERNGLLVPPKDSIALAEGMLRILSLSAEERIHMGENGRASVYPKYHITTLVRNIEALYTTLLARLNIT